MVVVLHHRFLLSCMLLTAFVEITVNATICDRNNASTCSYGGICKSSSNNHLFAGVDPVDTCTCAVGINCEDEGPTLVCDEEGNTHFNDVCRRVVECSIQRPLKATCSGGRCGSSDCKPIKTQPRLCESGNEHKCFNFGQCLLDDSGTPYCKCLSSYQGPRCETSMSAIRRGTVMPTGCEVTSASFDYRVAFLCMLGLFGLVLLLQITYCVIKCYSRKKNAYDFDDVIRETASPIEHKPGRHTSIPNCHRSSIPKSNHIEIGV